MLLMDTERLAREFNEKGCLVLEGFYEAAALEAVGQAVKNHYASAPAQVKADNFSQFETFTDPWVPESAELGPFVELQNDARLRSLTESVLGGPYAEVFPLMMQTRPGTGQAWHQDTQSHDPKKYVLNRIVYPLASPPGAGGLYCVPGSHRMGRIPRGPSQESLPGELRLHPKPGTLVLLHSFCFHRVSLNESQGCRYSVNLRCRPLSSPENYDNIGIYRNAGYDFRNQRVVDV